MKPPPTLYYVECEDYRLKGVFTKEEAEAKVAELNSDEAPCPLNHRAVT